MNEHTLYAPYVVNQRSPSDRRDTFTNKLTFISQITYLLMLLWMAKDAHIYMPRDGWHGMGMDPNIQV